MKVIVASKKEWYEFINECPSTTFFHSPAWYQVWKNYAGYGFEARLFEFENGKKALLPICWKKRLKGLINQYESGPAGTYGSFLTRDEFTAEESRLLVSYVQRFKNLTLRSNPLNPVFGDYFCTKPDFTQLLNLSEGWDKVLGKWSKGHASAAKKGNREGVEIKLAKHTDWPKYYETYLNTFNTWKNSPKEPYSYSLFEKIQKLDSQSCKLWLAFHNHILIAGCLCFYHNQHVVYWHGASLKQYYHLKPVHTLQFHIIKNALDQGFQWYDFNPSGGHPGVVKFKKGFGSVRKKANVYQKQQHWVRQIEKVKNNIL